MRYLRTCIALLAILLLAASCNKETSEQSAIEIKTGNTAAGADPLKVVCTTGMIADIVENVGGGHVELYCMMGPGVDPHLYQATTGDVQALADADIVFYNGLHLEAKLGDLLVRLASQRPVIAVTENIREEDLLSPAEFEGLHDPHVWMDVSLWMNATNTVMEKLQELDPERTMEYSDSGHSYIAELESTHKYLEELASGIPQENRILITAHDAFNYFGRAYGFEVRGLQGISTQAEAGTADVRELAEFIVDIKIPAIFVESSVPQRNIEAVVAACASRGWEVAIGGELFSDAMGSAGTPEGTYIGMVRHNMLTIVNALDGIVERDVPLSDDPAWAQP